jgi:hypothetical protein
MIAVIDLLDVILFILIVIVVIVIIIIVIVIVVLFLDARRGAAWKGASNIGLTTQSKIAWVQNVCVCVRRQTVGETLPQAADLESTHTHTHTKFALVSTDISIYTVCTVPTMVVCRSFCDVHRRGVVVAGVVGISILIGEQAVERSQEK